MGEVRWQPQSQVLGVRLQTLRKKLKPTGLGLCPTYPTFAPLLESRLVRSAYWDWTFQVHSSFLQYGQQACWGLACLSLWSVKMCEVDMVSRHVSSSTKVFKPQTDWQLHLTAESVNIWGHIPEKGYSGHECARLSWSKPVPASQIRSCQFRWLRLLAVALLQVWEDTRQTQSACTYTVTLKLYLWLLWGSFLFSMTTMQGRSHYCWQNAGGLPGVPRAAAFMFYTFQKKSL